jgi:transporter family-2 protein
MKLIWLFLAFTAGAIAPIHAGFNTRLGKSIGNPIYAAIVSFAVGTVALIMYALVTNQPVSLAGIRQAPPYIWFSGVLGAFYVAALIIAFPRIGPGLTFGLVVAGQMFMAVMADHFNVLVTEQRKFNSYRFFGVALIITGVVIIRKF